MHRIAATPGGWTPDAEGVIFVEQTPASILVLTAADTDIQTLAASVSRLPHQFPEIRVVNLLQLQQQLSIDTYAETVLAQAEIVILRLLGGRSYWSYGLEVIKETVAETKASLFVLPGDDRPDPDLISHSTVSLAAVNQLWTYLTEGGIDNYVNALQFAANVCLGTQYNVSIPQIVPRVGMYSYQGEESVKKEKSPTGKDSVGLIFYRAHYLAGNTAPIDALCQALIQRNLNVIPVFVSSLGSAEVQEELLSYFQAEGETTIQVLLNTTSFSLAKIGDETQLAFWQKLNVPILQVILSSGTKEYWESSFQGLTPRDVAMNVALPEVDGRIISRAVSFKSVETWNEQLETDVVVYKPIENRISFVADLAANWVRLKQTPISERKVALILANYPNRDGRLANGVGLDTPQSCVEILKYLQQKGYFVKDIPATGDELISRLTSSVTNDPEGRELRRINQAVSLEEYEKYFSTLPEKVQAEIDRRWGHIFESEEVARKDKERLIVSGIQLGNIFVGIQPSRGYDIDPSLNYHAPDLEPTPEYLAFYYWLREKFQANAIAHVGKHGNLEWLPGKSLALSQECYPEIAFGTLPHFYPFIVNDPGEGSQAKRRSHAVIIDHLTPPLTRAELYGNLQKLEGLIDEYYEAQSLDPTRLGLIGDRITTLVQQEHLDQELGVDKLDADSLAQFLTLADGYLCELKEAQIRDGLHIFGQTPSGRQLRDLMIAIARHPNSHCMGLTRAIAKDLNLDFDPLTTDYTQPFTVGNHKGLPLQSDGIENSLDNCKTVGDAVEILEGIAAELVDNLLKSSFSTTHFDSDVKPIRRSPLAPLKKGGDKKKNPVAEMVKHPLVSPLLRGTEGGSCPLTQKELNWIQNSLLPNLQKTPQEITNLLRGLDGNYIPSGAAGAPTRGRPEVLPTGRNFYSVDIRAIPTETAWDVGRKAAEAVIERYTQENGEYPRTLAISVWGTSTMRTGGDDIAEALALLGVQPIWDGIARRVVDFEILPVSVLGRPRVDVTLRISGFFRDGFPNLIDLFSQAVEAVSSLEESPEENPLAAQVKAETQRWQAAGLTEESAKMRSQYRIFGSKPGAYGAGLQGLIEAQNWHTDEDLAKAYINWSSYAYGKGGMGKAAPEAFEKRLQDLQIVLHNQDNREHDLLDSDDYYQFQGGLTAAVRAVSGKNPKTYFGDNSMPSKPKVRQLREEIARVYRSRVINPKWIEGVMRHGYKGAFEMAATVDYLFAYDATARCVEDYMYQGVAEEYIFNPEVQNFVQEKNPWALRDMAERLLEANQRGLWKEVSQETLEELRAIALQAEGTIEASST
ncbi:MAG: cobaltochelatase subunit CobN [Chroococcales cyanobacterium]